MTTTIEKNYIDVQTKTTHVLVDQKVILSEQELIDGFLDRILVTKNAHANLISEYKNVIEITVTYLNESRSVNELLLLSESIHNLVSTTKRLITTFNDRRFNGAYVSEAREYNVLVQDIQEIYSDVQGRIKNDKKIADLLDAI